MSTDKLSISRHKTTTTRAADAAPQHFDIIPAGKVRPSASGRPVITPTTPAVTDDMLKTESTAPELNLTHTTPNLEPPKSAPRPEEKGVLLSDLVAKREKAATSSEPSVDPEESQPAEASGKAADPDQPTAESDGTPAEDSTADKDETETAKPDEKAEAAADDSLDAVLKRGEESEVETPQVQSAALKSAMEEMDSKDGRPHHELYGGKPVIVVHKKHHMSAVAWLLWFIVCVGLAVVIVNFLLDAGIISTDYVIPHTNLL